MRELKFRVWNGMQMEYDITVGKFGVFYVNPMNGDGLDPDDTASLTSCNTKYPEDVIVMQYTGLKDKNGKEIYEGDILEGYKCAYPVTFKNGAFMWNDDFLGYTIEADYEAHYWITDDGCNMLEVVGNIYENDIKEVKEKIKQKAEVN